MTKKSPFTFGAMGQRQKARGRGPFAAIAEDEAEKAVQQIIDFARDVLAAEAIEGRLKVKPPTVTMAPVAEGEPQFYLALELVPKPSVDMAQLAELNTVQLFATAAAAPELFLRTYAVFRSLDAANQYAKAPGSAVLDIVPLCVEFNALLGY